MRLVAVLAGIAGLMLASASAMGQVTQTTSSPPAQNPPRLAAATSPHLDITPFGGGFVSEDYDDTDEGIQIEQSLTQGLGLIGRATGYQLYLRENTVSPLQASSNQTEARLNFGRFEGGIDISPLEGTNLYLLGGHDVGDSDAFVIEGDLSSWHAPVDRSSDKPVRCPDLRHPEQSHQQRNRFSRGCCSQPRLDGHGGRGGLRL